MELGTISFQSNGRSDVFHVAQVIEGGVELSDEQLMNVEDSQFDGDKAWATGRVPKVHTVDVEGDTTIVNAWLRCQSFDKEFVVRIYVEYELTEELEEVTLDEPEDKSEATDINLDSIEFQL